MKEIPLTQGYVALVDDEDYSCAIALGKWTACVGTHAVYAYRSARRPDGRQTTIKLHNYLTGWSYVDHINGDGLDNRRVNLRSATPATNSRNRGPRFNNRSGYKGVGWHKRAGKWVAYIGLNRKTRYLGLFDDPVTAALAYDAAAADLFGEFARFNFPQEIAS